MTAIVVRADARCLPLPDNSVDLIVTSPPYFGLRSYQDGGEHYAGQVGDEPTPAEFVDALLAVTRECVRVLKPVGSLWVNLGDKYAGAPSGPRTPMADGYVRDYETKEFQARRRTSAGVAPKSLMGIPWRYALACIDQLGLILRAEVVWSKPNGLPESVTDRVRRSHEQWFHFVLEPRYFSAVDEVREVYSDRVQDRQKYAGRAVEPNTAYTDGSGRHDSNAPRGILGFAHGGANPLGKLPGSVWTVPTQPLTVPAHLGVDHFAAFPMEWPRRIIQGWSPAAICTACGDGRRPVADVTGYMKTGGGGLSSMAAAEAARGNDRKTAQDFAASRLGWAPSRAITGYVCACPDASAPSRPAVVVDCFGGTGTTALVASSLGRVGISVDLSHDYSRLARWRTTDPGERARALQVERPPAQVDGQQDLFGDVA